MMKDADDKKLILANKRADEALSALSHINSVLFDSQIGIWEWDFEKDTIAVDETIQGIFGLKKASQLNTYSKFESFVHPEDRDRVATDIQSAIKNESHFFSEFRIISANSEIIYLASSGKVKNKSNKQSSYLSGICWDITDRVALEEKVIEFEGRKIAMDDITDGWWDWNLETNEQYMSVKFKSMFGYQDHEIENLAVSWQKIIHPDDLELALKNYEKHIATDGEYPYIQEVRYRHKEGHTVWVICRGKAIKNKDGQFVRMIGTHTDISALKQAEANLNILANHDVLTALPNRASFTDYLPRVVARAKRNNSHMALFYLDLDNFKRVNDSLGHNVGDILLKQVAERLLRESREVDFLARLGGDEFAVILDEINAVDQISPVAQRYIEALSKPFNINGHDIISSPSIGIAVYPFAGVTSEELLQHADAALYRSKEASKGSFTFFSEEINQRVQRQHLLEMEMHKAIQNEEFEMYYQPQFSVDGELISGVEALIRWPNDKLNNPSPGEFIPVAESSHMINSLGLWIIKKTIHDYLEIIKRTEQKELILSINVSAVQLSNDSIVKEVKNFLSNIDIDKKNILFELTETSFMKHIDSVKVVMESLHNEGLKFALDDFGIGYSSLQYLKHLPISSLKIDQSFVKDIGHDASDMAIIRAIISLAESLGLDTVAEGVEKKVQNIYLKQNGCTHVQGYYYAKPMPKEMLIDFINDFKIRTHTGGMQ